MNIKIIPRESEEEVRDESFGVRLYNINPDGAKLSKKAMVLVNIVTDLDKKRQQDAYTQLLAKIEAEEATTWGSQFVTACMLHPTKGENGEIQDIEFMDGLFHFSVITWKLVFAFIPPTHYGGGWPCFVIAIAMIGVVTWVVGEFANLFGCVLGIPPGITAITFVALGTSLPDTFASISAAQGEKYADSAIGNVTGSNSVNVYLGLGLPWAFATLYTGTPYYVPADSLGFSVVVFVICATICLGTLIVRRFKVGGELGGSNQGRLFTCIGMSSLWFVYVFFSIMQAYGKWGLADPTYGIDKVKPVAEGCCAKYNRIDNK